MGTIAQALRSTGQEIAPLIQWLKERDAQLNPLVATAGRTLRDILTFQDIPPTEGPIRDYRATYPNLPQALGAELVAPMLGPVYGVQAAMLSPERLLEEVDRHVRVLGDVNASPSAKARSRVALEQLRSLQGSRAPAGRPGRQPLGIASGRPNAPETSAGAVAVPQALGGGVPSRVQTPRPAAPGVAAAPVSPPGRVVIPQRPLPPEIAAGPPAPTPIPPADYSGLLEMFRGMRPEEPEQMSAKKRLLIALLGGLAGAGPALASGAGTGEILRRATQASRSVLGGAMSREAQAEEDYRQAQQAYQAKGFDLAMQMHGSQRQVELANLKLQEEHARAQYQAAKDEFDKGEPSVHVTANGTTITHRDAKGNLIIDRYADPIALANVAIRRAALLKESGGRGRVDPIEIALEGLSPETKRLGYLAKAVVDGTVGHKLRKRVADELRNQGFETIKGQFGTGKEAQEQAAARVGGALREDPFGTYKSIQESFVTRAQLFSAILEILLTTPEVRDDLYNEVDRASQ